MREHVNFKKIGFTLIELLVVMSIIGTLLSISVVGLVTYRNRAKVAKAKNEMRLYAMAFEKYHTDHIYDTDSWPPRSEPAPTGNQFTVPNGISGDYWKASQYVDYEYDNDNAGGKRTVLIAWGGLDGNLSDVTKMKDNIYLVISGDMRNYLPSCFDRTTSPSQWKSDCGELMYIK